MVRYNQTEINRQKDKQMVRYITDVNIQNDRYMVRYNQTNINRQKDRQMVRYIIRQI